MSDRKATVREVRAAYVALLQLGITVESLFATLQIPSRAVRYDWGPDSLDPDSLCLPCLGIEDAKDAIRSTGLKPGYVWSVLCERLTALQKEASELSEQLAQHIKS